MVAIYVCLLNAFVKSVDEFVQFHNRVALDMDPHPVEADDAKTFLRGLFAIADEVRLTVEKYTGEIEAFVEIEFMEHYRESLSEMLEQMDVLSGTPYAPIRNDVETSVQKMIEAFDEAFAEHEENGGSDEPHDEILARQELEDFAQDGYFENMEASEIL